jgi:hypothetical protein
MEDSDVQRSAVLGKPGMPNPRLFSYRGLAAKTGGRARRRLELIAQGSVHRFWQERQADFSAAISRAAGWLCENWRD